jgi:hypothetical protein
MVITPQKATNALSRKDRLELKKLEAQIDANLLTGKTAIGITGGLNSRLRVSLINRYSHAGWEVLHQVDSTNGADYLFFHEHREVLGFRQY